MKAEFQPLGAQDRADGVNLKVDVIGEDGRRAAVVHRLAPSTDRWGDKSERRYVCSCWTAVGMRVERKACAHIACVEAAVAASLSNATPTRGSA